MPLWGVDAAVSEAKPKWLSRAITGVGRLEDCFATEQGWVLRHYKNTAKTKYYDEILVAIGNLAGTSAITDRLDEATISGVYFTGVVGSTSGGSVTVVYNELVNVVNGTTLAIISDASNFNATAAVHTAVNKVVFTIAGSAVATGDELTIADATTISGTTSIVDAASNTVQSDKVINTADLIGVGGTGTYAIVTVVSD